VGSRCSRTAWRRYWEMEMPRIRKPSSLLSKPSSKIRLISELKRAIVYGHRSFTIESATNTFHAI
jgi:hypothetical protein